MTTNAQKTLLALAAGAMFGTLGAGSAVATAAPTTIYQDGFNRAGLLDGSTPTVDNGGLGGTAGATWSALNTATPAAADSGWATSTSRGGQLTYSGNPAGTATAYDGTAWLPFTPQSGQVYTAQVTFVAQTSGTAADWIGLFLDNKTSGLFGSGSNPWMFVRPDLSAHSDAGYVSPTAGFVGGPTAGGTTASGVYTSDTIVNTMILNTMQSNWTVQFKWNDLTNPGDSVTSAVTALGGTTSADQIGFVIVPPATGTATNFSLTAVPEPATLGLFGLGGLGLLLASRKRKLRV
jgi:hypothetical protein